MFGCGVARRALVPELERLGGRAALLVGTPSAAALAEELAAALGERVGGRFEGVRPHVPAAVAAAAVAAARECGADSVICLGGGSAIGTAKAVARETDLPILAVPTTYSGSEATPVWGLTQDGRKQTGSDPRVLPKAVLYDPELTVSLPAAVTAASGMNALAHCIEALYAPGRNPVTALIAAAATRALAAALPAAVERPGDVEARAGALYGAYLAGSAFAVAGSGLHHRICHVLGGAHDLPHAETHAVLIPHVVAFQESAAPEPMARIAAALGAAPGEPASAVLHELAARLGAPLALRDVGLPADGIEAVIPAILAAAPPDNPRPVDAAGVRTILASAYAGRPPQREPAQTERPGQPRRGAEPGPR